MLRPLTKHVITIWTEPQDATRDLEQLAREAVRGSAFCTTHTQEVIQDPLTDPAPPSQDFFDLYLTEEQDAQDAAQEG